LEEFHCFKMGDILKEILKLLPDKINDAVFEGANIVLYTKDKDYFLNPGTSIKDAVHEFKKRIELRPDPSMNLEAEASEKIIVDLIPKEANLGLITFDSQRSQVIIEVEKPGVAIGKQGSILKEIKEKTMWVPLIKRKPSIRSKLIETTRAVLYQHSDQRRKFLNQIGHRIYDGWIRGKKNEWIRVSTLGGGRQVGRSCLLLQTPESRILLDCGIDVASDDNAYPYLEAPEFKIEDLDAVVITHAHMDHAGLLPYLFKFGYKGPVYCTAPTRDVMSLMCMDTIKIMQMEGKAPLYDAEHVKQMVLHTIILDYEEVSDITPDVRLTLYNAGHIIGSSMVHLHIGNGLHNFLYTGDMKFGKTNLLDPAAIKFPRLETLMMESTYGGKDNVVPPRDECDKMSIEFINQIIKGEGKVLVPVLGVGRAQEVLLLIEEAIRTGQITEVPVYIDGMVWDITAIHTAYPEFLNKNVKKSIFHKDENPFLSPIFKRVGSVKERKQIIEGPEPCIILATSGMLVGGASVQYFKSLAENPKNGIMFTCYQGSGSLGKRIQNGEREFNMGSAVKPNIVIRKMQILTIDGLTGHSDRRQLMSFVHKCEPRPKKVILVHGESSRCLDLASSIHKTNRIETTVPRNLDSLRIR
jgi:uncharacterized protein